MNRELNISKNTASKIVKEYYTNYYDGMVNIKTKAKIENNDLYITLKKQTSLNGKNISLTETLTEGQISNVIKEYMEEQECYVDNIMFEPYFHNLNIRYHGNEFMMKRNKKGYEKVLAA